MKFLVVFGAIACLSSLAIGQTSIDLRTQTRDVDFSSAISTKPSKAGTTIPAICSPSETFFKLDAAAGQNLYLCTALNTWTLLSGGGSGSGTGVSLPFSSTASTSLLSITNGAMAAFGCNGANAAIPAGTTTAAPGTGNATETLRVGISCSDARLKLITPSNTFVCAPAGFSGCDTVAGNAFPDGVIPLASVVLTASGSTFTFGAVTDLRAPFQDDPPAAGIGLVYSKSGTVRTISIDTTVVPILSNYGDYMEIAAPGAPAAGLERVYAKAGSGFCAKDSSGVERCTGGTGGGGSSTMTETIQLPAAGCDPTGIARPLWYIPITNGAATTCNANGTAGLVYLNGSNAIATAHFAVPQGWTTGTVTLALGFHANTGGSNTFNVRTSCLNTGDAMGTPNWNSAQSVSLTTAFGMNYVTLAGVTMTGCAAGRLELIELSRTDASSNVLTLVDGEVRIVRSL